MNSIGKRPRPSVPRRSEVRRHPPKPIGPLARWNGKRSRTNRAEERRGLRRAYARCPREALCARRHNRPPSIPGEPPARGTEGSNLVPSSGESDANLTNTRRKRRPTGRQGLPLEGGEDRL